MERDGEMEEVERLKGLINRDEAVYQQVIEDYSKLLWAVAISVLNRSVSHADIEELISDVFLRLWRSPEKYHPEKGSLKNYLAMMTKSMSLNLIKKRARQFEEVNDFPFEELVDEPESLNHELWQDFFEALKRIPEPTQEICRQRFFYELKPQAISKQLKIPLKEVNNRLYNGKKQLRREMEYRLLLKE